MVDLANLTEVVRKVTVQGKTDGVTQATSELKDMAAAQTSLADASGKTNQVSDALSQALDKQSVSLDSAAKSAQSFGLGLGTLSVVGLGVGILDFVSKVNQGMLDLQTNARKAQMSLSDFQAIQYAGASVGVSSTDVTSSLTDAAKKLNDMKTDAGDVGKFLDANNVKWKDTNGQIISANQYLLVGSDLIKNAATYQDKVKAAGILGFNDASIPLLEQGSQAIQKLMDQAKANGAVFDDNMVNKAADFAREWTKASNDWATYFKAAIVSITPYLNEIIHDLPAALQAASDWMASHNIQLPTSGTNMSNLFDVSLPTIDKGSVADMAGLSSAIEALQNALGTGSNSAGAATDALKSLDTVAQSLGVDLGKAAAQAPAASGVPTSAGTTKFATDDNTSANAFSRAQDTVTKRTADYLAEAQAVGLDTDAKTKLKAIADLESAAQRAGIDLNQQQRDKILQLASAEGTAAQAAADAKQKFEGMNQAAQFAGDQLINVLDQLGQKGTTTSSIMLGLVQALQHAVLQATLLGSGPLAGVFGTQAAAGTGGTGGLIGTLLTGAKSGFNFAEGGIMTSRGPVPLRRYGGGGIASSPQLAMYGEGDTEEAYVPLPDGRSIPVSMKGNAGGAINISTNLNIDARGADPSSAAQLRAIAGQIVSQATTASVKAVQQARASNPNYFS